MTPRAEQLAAKALSDSGKLDSPTLPLAIDVVSIDISSEGRPSPPQPTAMPIPHASGLKGSNTLLSKHDTEPVQYAPSPRLAAAPRRPRSDTWPPAPVVATGWRLPRMLTSLKRQDSTIFSVFPKGTLSSVQVALSVVSALMGAGNLALPFAVAATGWVFVAILAGITGVCCYTANLLVEVIERVQPSTSSHISNYEKLAEQVGPARMIATAARIAVPTASHLIRPTRAPTHLCRPL